MSAPGSRRPPRPPGGTAFYALWITRNGQRMWDGPHRTMSDAQKSLERNLHDRETGSGTIARGVVPAADRVMERAVKP